jgi:DNA-binding response OmpR family regulator
MKRPKVLLLLDAPDLRAEYEMILRFSGYEPVTVESLADLQDGASDISAACILADHGPREAAMCTQLLAAAVPVVRIDPFIRHAREHLPFDVVLPMRSEPRQLITALHHLLH